MQCFKIADIHSNWPCSRLILPGGNTSRASQAEHLTPQMQSEELGFVGSFRMDQAQGTSALWASHHHSPSTLLLKMALAGLLAIQLCQSFILPDPQPFHYSNCKHTSSYCASDQANRRHSKHLRVLNIKGHQGAGSMTPSGSGMEK